MPAPAGRFPRDGSTREKMLGFTFPFCCGGRRRPAAATATEEARILKSHQARSPHREGHAHASGHFEISMNPTSRGAPPRTRPQPPSRERHTLVCVPEPRFASRFWSTRSVTSLQRRRHGPRERRLQRAAGSPPGRVVVAPRRSIRAPGSRGTGPTGASRLIGPPGGTRRVRPHPPQDAREARAKCRNAGPRHRRSDDDLDIAFLSVGRGTVRSEG
jgi:hypothetical protein